MWILLVAAEDTAQGGNSERTAIREIHSSALSPSSDALFAAESKAPSTDAAWLELRRHASALADAARALSSLPRAKGEKKWQKLAVDLRRGAQAATRGAESHSLEILVEANGKIVAACEGCHDDYRDRGHGMTSDKSPQP